MNSWCCHRVKQSPSTYFSPALQCQSDMDSRDIAHSYHENIQIVFSVKAEYSKFKSEVYSILLCLCQLTLKAEFGPFFLWLFKEVEYLLPFCFTLVVVQILQIDITAKVREKFVSGWLAYKIYFLQKKKNRQIGWNFFLWRFYCRVVIFTVGFCSVWLILLLRVVVDISFADCFGPRLVACQGASPHYAEQGFHHLNMSVNKNNKKKAGQQNKMKSYRGCRRRRECKCSEDALF